jgi:nucleoside-specific outer membrane channel protein Tsx
MAGCAEGSENMIMGKGTEMGLKGGILGLAAAMAMAMAPAPVTAGGFTAANIQFLYGVDQGDFAGTGVEKGEAFPMLTFELANGWTYGDNFFFTDWNHATSFDTAAPLAAYGELHSRLSAGKISGKSVGFGPVSDLLLAGEIDYPAGFTPAYCYGLGVDLKIPGFAFAFVNFFVRDEVGTDGVSFQINPVWMVPFKFGPVAGSFGGWVDLMTGEGDNQDFWWQMQPTLMIDAGNFWGSPGKLMVGCEYEYFNNFLGLGLGDVNHPQFVALWNL